MNPAEIVAAQIRHEETEVVPYTLAFEEEVGSRLDAHYRNPGWRDRLTRYIEAGSVVETMKKLPTGKLGYEVDPYGSVWRTDRRPFHLERPGLEAPTLSGYSWPTPEEFFVDHSRLGRTSAWMRERAGTTYLAANLGWGLFETSWGLRGFENALSDSIAEVDFYHELIDRITEQFLRYIEFTCDSLPEADAIMFGDDWGYQHGVLVGPDRWREFFKEPYRRIYDAVHRRGKTVISHCCGSIVDILDDVVEIGLDVLESVQPEARGMNPYELKSKWGDKLCFWGALGSQSTIQFGPPEEIHREVRRLRTEMSVGGGYILAPAKGLQPGTPTENAVAVVEAFTSA